VREGLVDHEIPPECVSAQCYAWEGVKAKEIWGMARGLKPTALTVLVGSIRATGFSLWAGFGKAWDMAEYRDVPT
jgi:hypothetical protein